MRPDKKQHILQVASDLFNELAPANTSLRKIADKAGVSKALLLKEWTSRSNLIIATLDYERLKIANIWSDVGPDSSIEALCFKILSTYKTNPRYFSLITQVSIDCPDPEIQQWLKERVVYGQLQGVLDKLNALPGHQHSSLQQWSPEALSLFASICTFALPVLSPKILNWYGVPEENQAEVEAETLMLFVQALVGRS